VSFPRVRQVTLPSSTTTLPFTTTTSKPSDV
jgi:hypothetical protein